MAKALYHSELTKRGETTLKILGEVRESKYAGKPPFLFVELDGEERALNIENEKIESKLIFKKGDLVRVKATGSRESADIEILSGGDTYGQGGGVTDEKPNGLPKGENSPLVAAQAPTVRSTSSNGAVRTLDTVATGFYAALGKADELVTQFFSDAQRESWSAYEAADLVLRVAAGLNIESNRR